MGVDLQLVDGLLDRESTIETRCLIRLLTRRGEWIGDPEIGSRLHQIRTLKNASRQVEDAINEALRPLLDDGSIAEVRFLGARTDSVSGFLQASIEIVQASGDVIPIGEIPIGQIAPPTAAGFEVSRPQSEDPAPRAEAPQALGWKIDTVADYSLSDGLLVRDETIVTRCLIRLKTRRGEWIGDPRLGSRLHEIRTLKNAEAVSRDAVQLALQPMIDDGSILSVEQTRVEIDNQIGALAMHVTIRVPSGGIIDLGRILLGEAL